jgi:hypothetical protein
MRSCLDLRYWYESTNTDADGAALLRVGAHQCAGARGRNSAGDEGTTTFTPSLTTIFTSASLCCADFLFPYALGAV